MFNMTPYRRAIHTPSLTPSLFDDRFMRSFFDMTESAHGGFHVDVRDQENQYLLEAELPGMSMDNIDVSVDKDVLTISASRKEEKTETTRENYIYSERRSGHVQRSFTLKGIDQDGIQASYENGVLAVTLPKMQPEQNKTQRKIAVRQGGMHPTFNADMDAPRNANQGFHGENPIQ